MNITSVTVHGFRAFTKEHTFDLNADVVLFTGANGRGKTSLFDAILWCLTGSVPRIEENTDIASIISLYSDSGQARVEVTLQDRTIVLPRKVRVIRSFDSEHVELSVHATKDTYRGADATHWILSELWPQAQAADRAPEAFSRAFTRSVYLQQDLVRQFVEADNAKERYVAVSELVGLGRFTELNKKLDTQRKKWKTKLNAKAEDVEDLRVELEAAKSRRDSLRLSGQAGLGEVREKWSEWWRTTENLGVDLVPPAVDTSNAASVLENGIQALQATMRGKRRDYNGGVSLLEEIGNIDSDRTPSDIEALEQQLSEAQSAKDNAASALERARQFAARQREEQVRRKDRAEELATLAEIALRHIDDDCPVCTQSHEEERTRKHLKALIEQVANHDFNEPVDVGSGRVDAALERLEEKERAFSQVRDAYKTAVQERKYRQECFLELEAWVEKAPINATEFDEVEAAAREGVARLWSEVEQVKSHIELGKDLSLRLANVSQESMYEETSQRVVSLQSQLEELVEEVETKQQASELADTFVEEIERATEDYIVDRLDSVSELLQHIYTKVDPHPTFRSIRLTPHFSYRRGRLNPFVRDRHVDVGEQDPFSVMSSSQVNVVALSIFLALNLGIPTVPLKTLILDDPLQSLDDINLLGLLDLIRRSRDHRQIFLSTHDSRLFELLKQKLRPVQEDQRTRVIEFRDWTRRGPETESTDVERDKNPLRLVAA